MRIKKLEIEGFKSFADQVVVHFGHGVTGVVGPNGCGKSNIVDALRWVMGEMRAKHLRGGHMQDIIFGGSQNRGPSGRAEVTVTFENDGQGVPVEYQHLTEIAVTRRLYRNGDSEYEINRTKCRLKDITELFLGTGAGAKAYAIIEQGRVGMIVSSKPADRRLIIEEAAGITKYKARRQAAERKMEATRQNLLRITDVTREVEKRLGSLKRQANKAERYKRLRTQVRDIELHHAAARHLELVALLGYDIDAHTRFHEDKASLDAGLSLLDVSIETERAALLDEDRRLGQEQARLFELDSQLALLDKENEHKKQAIEDSHRREEEARIERERIVGQRQLLADELAGYEADYEEAERFAESHELQIFEMEEALQTATQRRRDTSDELTRLQKATSQAAAHAAKMQAQISAIQDRKVELQKRIERLDTELSALDEELESSDGRILELEGKLEDAEATQESGSDELEDIEVRAEDAARALKNAEAERRDLLDLLSRNKNRLLTLEEISQNFERSPEGVRAVMARPAAERPGITGVVSALFEAPVGKEQLVELALAERLGAVLASTEAAADAQADWLEAQDAGRAEFVVAAALGPCPAVPDGAVSMLDGARLSGVDDETARRVLSRIWTAPNRASAEALWSAARAAGATIVTPGLDVFFPGGELHTGPLGDANASVLRQQREMRELAETVEKLEARLESLEQARHTAEAESEALTAQKKSIEDRARSLEMALINIDNDLARAKDDTRRLDERRRQVADEAVELEAALKQCDADIADKKDSWAGDLDMHASSEDRLDELEGLLTDFDLEVDERQEALTSIKVRAASDFERRDALKRSIAHHQRTLEEIEDRALKLEDQIEDAAVTRDELSLAIEDAIEQGGALAAARGELSQSLEEARAAFQARTDGVRDMEQQARHKRSEADKLNKDVTAVQLRIQQHQLALNAVHERLHERYSLTITDILHDYHLLMPPDPEDVALLDELKKTIDKLGHINLTAIEEYEELSERFVFLKTQTDDLTAALEQLEKAILKINRTTKKRFEEAFHAINERFQQVFPRLFRGGKAWLSLTDPGDLLGTGVEIYAQPPGKKLGSVALMSGGEKALTAVSLIFAIFLIKPSPFCLLDEVDAPLDEANVGRFSDMVKEMSAISQFIVITHNKRTMEVADQLYGITMEEPGISKTVNVRIQGGFDDFSGPRAAVV